MKIQKIQNSLIVALTGEIDHHNSSDIKCEIDNELEKTKAINLIMDFSNVSFMDSAGVGLIIGRYKLIAKQGGTLAVVGIKGAMDRIFDISGIYKIAMRFETSKDALDKIESL